MDTPFAFGPPVTTGDTIARLELLASRWANATSGTGPDGAFVDVSGPRREGEPTFPSLLAQMLRVHVAKQAAYVGSQNLNPLANYVRAGESIGVPGYLATFMRLSEKQARLAHLLQSASTRELGVAADGETIEETLLDIAILALLTIPLYRIRW